MNGVLKFSPKWFTLFRPLLIAGGPYAEQPNGSYGICLLESVPRNMQPDVWFPIVDFSVPDDDANLRVALEAALGAMLDGELVYVGCMAGRGRTGLFLSLLSKIIEQDVHPVLNVRQKYFSHAVETEEQQQFVEAFDPAPFRKWMFWRAVAAARGKAAPDIAPHA